MRIAVYLVDLGTNLVVCVVSLVFSWYGKIQRINDGAPNIRLQIKDRFVCEVNCLCTLLLDGQRRTICLTTISSRIFKAVPWVRSYKGVDRLLFHHAHVSKLW